MYQTPPPPLSRKSGTETYNSNYKAIVSIKSFFAMIKKKYIMFLNYHMFNQYSTDNSLQSRWHQTQPRNHPVPFARSVQICTLTHACFHAFTHSARSASNHLSPKMVPRKQSTVPHAKLLVLFPRRGFKQFQKTHTLAMKLKLRCMNPKSIEKLQVSVVSAVAFHHNPSCPSAAHAAYFSASRVMNTIAALGSWH